LSQEEPNVERMEVLMKQYWRHALAGAAAIVAMLATAGTASAGVLVKTTTDCSGQALSTPFTPWLDRASYTPLPGGSFEGGAAGWKLSGGAKVVAGNESFKVHGSGDGTSLRLPAGSSALSAPICVGLEHPTVRFFAKKNSGLLSTLAVSVYVKTSLGLVVPVPVGVVLGNGQWKATPKMLIVANLLPLLPGDRTPVAFQFTPLLGDWQIDDVYVDPMRFR
jgi:hypothetical protein